MEEVKKKLRGRNPTWDTIEYRYNEIGEQLCFNPECSNVSRRYKNSAKRFRRFCSKNCEDDFLNNFSWTTIRYNVLNEQRFTCQECGARADEVHHIIPVSAAPDKQFDYTNLIALCKKCHRRHHHKRRAYASNIKKLDAYFERDTK